MAHPTVIITTSLGVITAELYADKAPITVANFLRYVDEDFYRGTIFHRVIPTFMVQGGGFEPSMNKKVPHEPIKNEAANGLKNTLGTLAMARTNVPDSATAQFFINTVDNAFLDFRDPSPSGIGYCVFGKVTRGLDVVAKIKVVPTGVKDGMKDVPLHPVLMESVTRG
jgi:peptidyl-prolyl cis-trans isomerase B (cyclophilin B)